MYSSCRHLSLAAFFLLAVDALLPTNTGGSHSDRIPKPAHGSTPLSSSLNSGDNSGAVNGSVDDCRVLPDKDISNVFTNNIKWKKEKLSADPDFFNNLASGHRPDYMWIGT
jgi:hypothetical protein